MTGPDSLQSSCGDSGDTSAPRRGGGPNRRRFWILYTVALISTTSFAVWAGLLFFGAFETDSRSVRLPSVRRGYGRIGPPASAPAQGPGEMTDNPLAGVGMKPLDDDPDGLKPPPGSLRRWAFVRRTGDEVEMMAQYSWRGSFDAAAEYYKKYLGDKGMEFLGQQSPRTPGTSTRPKSTRAVRPRRVLVFHALKKHASVTLRHGRKNDQMLLITLNLVYPEP